MQCILLFFIVFNEIICFSEETKKSRSVMLGGMVGVWWLKAVSHCYRPDFFRRHDFDIQVMAIVFHVFGDKLRASHFPTQNILDVVFHVSIGQLKGSVDVFFRKIYYVRLCGNRQYFLLDFLVSKPFLEQSHHLGDA